MRILEERKQYIIEYVIIPTTGYLEICLTDKITNQIFLEKTKEYSDKELIRLGKKLIRRWKKEVINNAIH